MAKTPAIKVALLKYGLRRTDKLYPSPNNARTHPEAQIKQIAASISRYGFPNPILATTPGEIVAGHGRHEAAKLLGLAEVPTLTAPKGWSADDTRAYMMADNQLGLTSEWDEELLRREVQALDAANYDLSTLGFGEAELEKLLGRELETSRRMGSLAEAFGVPPFSVLSAREGWWQDRKRAWLALGIQSELGRGENLSALDGAIERREAIKKKPHAIHSGKVGQGGLAAGVSRAAAKANATPGGSKLPAANYSQNRKRGDGRGRPVNG